jgi:hypothetical protein
MYNTKYIMTEKNTPQAPHFETAERAIAETAADLGLKMGSDYQDRSANYTADGQRYRLAALKSGDTTMIQATQIPTNEVGVPQKSYSPPKGAITLAERDGVKRMVAEATIDQGTYRFAEGADAPQEVTVTRPGYKSAEGWDQVVIRNPRAKELITRIAARNIGRVASQISEHRKKSRR